MKIRIKYLDGARFKRSIIASAKRVIQAEDHLNDINVFPVADGDTGTNMAVTMNNIVSGAQACHESSFAGISNAIADSALSGARGNSGAILAQFFQGLAEATREKASLTTKAFAEASAKAVEKAINAIANPVEGTIITVMKDWANHLLEHAHKTHDFVDLLKASLERAKDSLAATPEKLKVLKKAGVVDAGAEGFVDLIQGVVDFIDAGKIAALKTGSHVRDKIRSSHIVKAEGAIKYRFCVECLIEGRGIDRDKLRQVLQGAGDSLIVIGSEKKVRVHIHTNEPQEVFELSAGFGSLVKTKADDMRRQHKKIIHGNVRKKIVLVTDSTCDLPAELIEKYHIQIVPVMLHAGRTSYRDREDINLPEFYNRLQTTDQRFSTSQPPPASFSSVYDKLAPEYEAVLSIHISGNISGTIQGARMGAAGSACEEKISIFDSKTTSASLGLLVAEAGKMIEEEIELADVITRLERLRPYARIFIHLPTLKYLVRSGRLSPAKGIIGTLLNLKPVISMNPEGKIAEVAKVMGRRKVELKTLELALRFARSVKDPRFSVAHVLALELAEQYKEQILRHFPGTEVLTVEATPALGVHTGIGSAGIAVLGEPAD
jgi:DegV family protein with EDD domain